MSDDDYVDDDTEIETDFDGELDEDALVDDDDVVEDVLDDALDVDEVLAVIDGTDDDDDDDDDVAVTVKEDDDEVIDLDEELHPDDVEEALDVVLRERTAKATLDEDEEDDEPDDRGEASNKIVPRRVGEFVCSSCFLVLPRHMLADTAQQLCSDCV